MREHELARGAPDVTVYFDGASVGNCSPLSPRFADSRASWAFWAKGNGGQILFEDAGRLPGLTGTNNMAELTAALRALEWAHARGSRFVCLRGDSQVVIDFLNGVSRISDKPWLARIQYQFSRVVACESLLARDGQRRVLQLLRSSKDGRLILAPEHIPESKNKHADELSKKVLAS